MIIGSQITILRTALRELEAIFSKMADLHPSRDLREVLPDPAGLACRIRLVLADTFIPEIEHASEVERRIVGKLVQDALAAGYSLSVWDGEELALCESGDADAIYRALASTDSDTLYIHTREKNPPGVVLVWGNDCSVISDYNTSLETLLAGANALADELEG